MSTDRILIHGSTAQRMTRTPAIGQIGSDDTLKKIVLGDGSTPGGKVMPDQADVDAAKVRANHTGTQDIATVTGLISFGGRLSLASGSPTSESDISGGVNIYYVPLMGAYVPIYNGTVIAMASIGTQLTLALDNASGHAGYHQSGKNFDLFAINDAGTIRLGTGPSWNSGAVAGSDVARGTGAGSTDLERFNGLLVNANAMTVRFGAAAGNTVSVPARQGTYLGSFRATADGQASDSKAQRLLFNAYNVMFRNFRVAGTAASYTYSTDAWQSLANAGLKAEILLGLTGTIVKAQASALVQNSTDTVRVVRAGIGLDSMGAPFDGALTASIHATTQLKQMLAAFEDCPGLGYHYLAPLERGAGTDTQTWYAYGSGIYRAGMIGSLLS
ncbi:hypothetical protein PH552_12400 [Rhizobium sp. CNPSo 3968]|uniref:hypothetical protein n=1 Tax=Rhizobium sp. CNPSo 3968 TaxID=3021408 RepID=UPI002549C883|nr:hypothetical protein [Rhizobium sp. CNPSo 3968]MDK4720145.1 hypothetical protein [Rhizobium sp. CNPSo 3968]